MSKNLSRRTFLKISAALTAAGILAWESDTEIVDASPVIGVDPAKEGGDYTSVFPGLDEVITTGHLVQPFEPYHLDPDCPPCQAILADYFRGYNE